MMFDAVPPPPGAGTGDDGAAYATLLNTVESLQADLQQTITTCHSLREQNAILQRLQSKHNLSEAAVAELRAKNEVLAQVIRKLRAKVGE